MDGFNFKRIGVVHSGWNALYHAPRQPDSGAVAMPAVIELAEHCNYEQALLHLDGFSKLWVVWVFDRVTSWKPLVKTPRDRVKHGVFATRSPHRPNPIAISCVHLERIEGLRLFISNCDMLDKTPVLDIKPYIPEYDSFPNEQIGWLESVKEEEYTCSVSELAKQQCEWIQSTFARDILSVVVPTVSRDPFPHPYRRIRARSSTDFVIAYRTWRVLYSVVGSTVTISEVQSCYSKEFIEQHPTEIDAHEHIAFFKLFSHPHE